MSEAAKLKLWPFSVANRTATRQTRMKKKILVVEDEAIMRKHFCLVLRYEGYEVHEASNGVQAVELLERQEFDLLISDLVMPRLDGLKLAELLQRRFPETPIILVTALPNKPPYAAALPGVVEYLTKPFELGLLISVVKRLLGSQATPSAARTRHPAVTELLQGIFHHRIYKRIHALIGDKLRERCG
jgi:CheY-like chemotaxis protein